MKCHAHADPLNILGTVIEQKKLIKSEIIVNFFFSFPNRNILLCFIPVSFYEIKTISVAKNQTWGCYRTFTVNCFEKTKKEKESGNGPFKKH